MCFSLFVCVGSRPPWLLPIHNFFSGCSLVLGVEHVASCEGLVIARFCYSHVVLPGERFFGCSCLQRHARSALIFGSHFL